MSVEFIRGVIIHMGQLHGVMDMENSEEELRLLLTTNFGQYRPPYKKGDVGSITKQVHLGTTSP